jgi:pimeloyl-ACP methyl ester carboxylesterase
MPDRPLVIIHGWSDHSASFENLAKLLEEALSRPAALVDFADYVSMDDEVTFDDLVAAMSRAWRRAGLPESPGSVDVVVHSTGGLVIRDWLSRCYRPEAVPIKHLLMLAPADFGSPLAHKGYSFIGRIFKGWSSEKTFQTGEQILKGLELASPYSWDLALRDRLGKDVYYGPGRILCTVLVGNTGYSGIAAAANEPGSDGTVRVSTANMTCAALIADFSQDPLHPTFELEPSVGTIGFGVSDGDNHATIAGKNGGPVSPAARENYRQALSVADEDFEAWCGALAQQTRAVMGANASDDYKHGYQNTVVLVEDQFGRQVGDYFLEFYVQDDAADDFARMFHEQAIQTAHAYGDDHAYRSLLIDCTALNAHLAQDPKFTAMKVSLSAKPDFDQNGNVGYKTFTDEDIGAITLDRQMIASVFQENRTLLVRIILRREQADKVFEIRP